MSVVAAAANRTLAGGTQRERFWTDVPFTKAVSDKGDLTLQGYASTWVEDRDGEVVDPTAFDKYLPLYLAKNPILLWQHNHDWPLGAVTGAEVDEHGLGVKAFVRKPQQGEEPWKFSAYYDIKAGIVKTFSIGGWMTRELRAAMPVITEVELWEISCVSIPSNPDSIYQAAVKAIKGEHRPGLHTKAIEQMAQILGLQGMSDPELARMDEPGRKARYEMLAAMYRKAGRMPPEYEDWQLVAARVAEQEDGASPGFLAATADVIGVVKRAHGLVQLLGDEKKGRVLSKANEGKLRDARDRIDQVLAAVAAEDPEGDAQLAAPVRQAKAPGDLIWGPEEGVQDLMSDLRAQLNPPGADAWRYDVYDITTDLTRALVCDWPSGEWWVAPFTVDAAGEPTLAPPGQWVAAEQGWVQSAEGELAVVTAQRAARSKGQ